MRTKPLTKLVLVLVPSLLLACGKEEKPPTPATPKSGAPSSLAAAPSSSAPAATPSAAPVETTVDALVGKPAPDFTAKTQSGKTLHLAELKGKPVVVYFYPKDETPGCTKEACSFRDGWNDLAKTGVVMIGISTDDDESHRKFAEHHKLPFDLVSDPKGAIAKSFGVPMIGDNGMVSRQTIVIGADGAVKKVYRKVDVTAHTAEILGDLKLLGGA